MSLGDGFKGHALAPLRQADERIREEQLEEALRCLGTAELTRALEFAVDWTSVQMSMPRGRIERKLAIPKMRIAISHMSLAQEQSLAIVRQHNGGLLGFLSGFVRGFVDAYTGLPVGGAISKWLASAARNARLKGPFTALKTALDVYEIQVCAGADKLEQLNISNQQPRGTPLHLLAAAALAGIATAAIGAWFLFGH